jgi:flagellar assembly protein FliH
MRSMSDIIKIPSARKLSVKEGASEKVVQEDKGEMLQQQLRFQYESGYDHGYNTAQAELEQQYAKKLLDKYDEILTIFYDFNERADEYDRTFEKIIIELSFIVSELLIKKEVERDSIIVENLKGALKKILGANQIIIKLNPGDLSRMNEDSNSIFAETGLSKLRFESTDSVEKGGCLIETDIGSVDARISTQLHELKKSLMSSVFYNGIIN